jgi:hypothetical protein
MIFYLQPPTKIRLDAAPVKRAILELPKFADSKMALFTKSPETRE